MTSKVFPNDHFFYRLGPVIAPNREVRTGKRIFQAQSAKAAIDLLLTCDTIAEARGKTRDRLAAAGG